MSTNGSKLRPSTQRRPEQLWDYMRDMAALAEHSRRRLAEYVAEHESSDQSILDWQGCYGFWNPDFPRP